MKTLFLIIAIAFSGTALAQMDMSRCVAAKKAVNKLVDIYISKSIYCSQDSDCAEVNYAGGPVCGNKIVNKVGLAGSELMKSSPEYQRLAGIISEEFTNGGCGPLPMCAPRPPGALVCSQQTNQCIFQIQD